MQISPKNRIAIVRDLRTWYTHINMDYGGDFIKFISARKAADKWGIFQRRVAVLCSENRIDNSKN